MVKKIITSLDSSKATGPNCIPVVVLKHCESELSCILVEFFNMCLLGTGLLVKATTLLVFFLWLVKVLKNW